MKESHTAHLLHARTLYALASLGITGDTKLLLAVSGGPDSLSLLHVVQSVRGTGAFADISVAHVNHHLREPASNIEEAIVRRYCEEWNVPVYVSSVPTAHIAEIEKSGIEETARKLRYQFFETLVETHGFDFVLTAHTANDQAETVILNMMRGAGVRGLAGIPPKRKLGNSYIIRPWLDVTRSEISEYLREHRIIAAHDTSNDELTYQRNRVRHKVMPILAEVWPDRSPVKSLSSLATRMRELSHFLDQQARSELKKLEMDGGLSLEGLKSVHPFLLHITFEIWIHRQFGHYGLSSEESSRIADWLSTVSPRMELRKGLSLRKDGNVLRLESDGRHLIYHE
jgi:bifunctional protein TilS/HprT